MREHKFRGKRVDNGEWVYGDLSMGGGSKPNYDKDRTFIEPREPVLRRIEVLPETVGEYTGLKDKRGKEDWTDDIAKTKVGPFTYYRKIFQADSGAYCINLPTMGATGGESAIMLITCEHENVGNIHSNPELMKESE